MIPDEEAIRTACEAVGIDAAILIAALSAQPPPQKGEAPVHYMAGRRAPISRDYVPLSSEELDALGTIFVTNKQSRVPGSVILNSLCERATTGKTLEGMTEHAAVYMRMRRSFRRGEFAAILDLVRSRPDVFSPERVKAFESLAATEVAYRARNGWDRVT